MSFVQQELVAYTLEEEEDEAVFTISKYCNAMYCRVVGCGVWGVRRDPSIKVHESSLKMLLLKSYLMDRLV